MDFDFFASLEKAEEVDGKYFIAGIASTNDVDQQDDIISSDAIAQMAKSAVGLPIVRSHDHEGLDEFGTIIEAKAIDNNSKLYIKAELDADDSEAMRAYKKIATGKKFGFSIGGKINSVKNAMGKARREISSLTLRHIMLTTKPVNQFTLAQAINKALSETEEPMEDTNLEKAGAMFSADNKSKLKAIHDSGDNTVKSMIRELLGSDAQEVLGNATDVTSDSDPVGVADDGDAYSDPDAVAKSTQEIKAMFAEMKEAVLSELKSVSKSETIVESKSASDEEINEALRNFFKI